MISFTVHNRDSAPENSLEYLQEAEKIFGFVPNLIDVLAESPAAVKAYLDLYETFNTASLSPTERQVVLLTASRYAQCDYCIASQSTVAEMSKVPFEVIDAIRNAEPIAIYKLEALRGFTIAVLDKHGRVSHQDINAFFEAGYGKQQLLEIILGISMMTLSNYVNHISDTPVDNIFIRNSWSMVSTN